MKRDLSVKRQNKSLKAYKKGPNSRQKSAQGQPPVHTHKISHKENEDTHPEGQAEWAVGVMHNLEADEKYLTPNGTGKHHRPQITDRYLESGNGRQSHNEERCHEENPDDLQIHTKKRSPQAGAGRIADIVIDHKSDADYRKNAVDRFQCFILLHEDTSPITLTPLVP
jgi:hypothetical protein